MQFLDRHDAGRRLAAELLPLAPERLDILAVRKLGAPGNLELGVGAVAEDGTGVLDPWSAGAMGMTQAVLDATLVRESLELRRRVERYRDGRPSIDVNGRTVIVVDDGLATGLTDLAAVRALRKRGARRIIVAVPAGPYRGGPDATQSDPFARPSSRSPIMSRCDPLHPSRCSPRPLPPCGGFDRMQSALGQTRLEAS